MAFEFKRRLVLLLGGTSLTNGRLATPDNPWDSYLQRAMEVDPACQGPITIINTAQGSATSAVGVTQAARFAPLRPTHILTEDFGINDCVPANAITTVQQTANLNTMRASYLAANPDVIITHMTMSPASAADANRLNLADYYAAGTAWAAGHGYETLDIYAAWPKPLELVQTVDGDGLHPLWIANPPGNAFGAYSYPSIFAWAQRAMEEFWG